MKQFNNIKNSFIKAVLVSTLCVTSFLIQSCSDYLDVVPDNVATLDNAFTLKNEAEKYLFTCYSFLPKNGNINSNIGMLSGDEMWISYKSSITPNTFEIARGNQRVSNPFVNVWQGSNGGGGIHKLFVGIRHCNIFIENIKKPENAPDLETFERNRWLAEVQFLKAYYHYYLLRMYGPIPITDVNVPLDAPEDQINVTRDPVDDCVAYIVKTLDEAIENLPDDLQVIPSTEAGRVSKTIALAVKAKVLLLAASPLFNGNTELNSFVGNEGENLINPSYDENKWKLAADASLAAIESAHANGKNLYVFPTPPTQLSDTTLTQMSIRQAVCEPWNREILWANPNSSTTSLQQLCMAPIELTDQDHNDARKPLSVPLKIARMFYSKNGVPIKEDATLDFTNEKELRIATTEERFNIKENFTTARLNFDREPRFYANLGFDGGMWYKKNTSNLDSDAGNTAYFLEGKFGDKAGATHPFHFNVTGYFVKKLVHWEQSGAVYENYAWPEIRLADLYLMYAEALNEVAGPTGDVYTYIDLIRERAGLNGVVDSWVQFSSNPSKPTTKEGLREIIHQERLIELALEGQRFWDLRRWKKAAENLNNTITGWNVRGEEEASYYQETTLYQQSFVSPRDYFWPIPETSMIKNLNLVQNPGW